MTETEKNLGVEPADTATSPPDGDVYTQSIAAQVEALRADLGETPISPGATQTTDAQQVSTADLLAGLLMPGFSLIAPNWGVTQQECNALAEAWGPVIDKWVPDLAGRFGIEINAALITIAVFAPRWGRPRKIAEPEQPDKKTDTGSAGESVKYVEYGNRPA